MVHPEILQAIPLFQHLSERRLKRVVASSLLERYQKGAVLFRQGEHAEAMWVILEGWVHLVRSPEGDDPSTRTMATDRGLARDSAPRAIKKVLRVLPVGLHGSRAVVLFTITPREVLCGISAIESGTYNLSAMAGTDCRVVRIPGEAFNEALRHEPAFTYEALRLCARRIQSITQQYGAIAEPVPRRVVRAILRLRQQFGTTLPVTHRELAQMSWTTTESAIRIVRRLKQRGYMTGTRGRLRITQLKALERLLAQPNGHPTL